MSEEEKIQWAIQYAWQMIGTPYIWGGENPLEGYDCSGFVQEILRSVGLDPKGDQTAQALFDYFYEDIGAAETPRAGALAFYGSRRYHVSHVAFCINKGQIIEAAGGGSRTRTKADAEKIGAFVRIRPVDARSDLIGVLMPNYEDHVSS